MIGEYLTQKYKSIDKNLRICFFTAMIAGILAHIYALTNHLYNYDELNAIPANYGLGVTGGRWGLEVLANITKFFFDDVYSIPAFNGMLAIILYSIVACISVKLFEINDSYFAAAIGAIIVTFPSVVCRMFFMYVTHFYALGEVIVALGALVFLKNRKKIGMEILAVLLVAFGTAIYQSVFVTAVCLVVGVLLVRLIKEDMDVKSMIMDTVAYLVFLGASMATYFISHNIALKVTGSKMIEHAENYDTMGQMSLGQLINGIVYCYKCFVRMPLKSVYSANPNILVMATFLISIIAIAYSLIMILLSKKNIVQKVLMALTTVIIPIAVNLIYIMSISSGVMYAIMTFDIVYILVIAIAEIDALKVIKINEEGAKKLSGLFDKIYKPLNVAMAIALLLTTFSYIWYANGNYLCEEYTNIHDNAYYQVLMTQVKSIDGYADDMPVVVLGTPQHDSTDRLRHMIEDTFDLSGKGTTNVSAYSSWKIMSSVLGYDPQIVWAEEEIEQFKSLDEVKEMPCYPAKGSIRIVNGTMVIKFSEE